MDINALKPDRGIIVVINDEFQGIVCRCGNTDETKLETKLIRSKSKSITGIWNESEKLYVRCTACGMLEDHEAFHKSYKNLETFRKGTEVVAPKTMMDGEVETYTEKPKRKKRKYTRRKKSKY